MDVFTYTYIWYMYVNTREYIEMSRSFNLKFYYQASNMVLKTDHVRFFIFSLSQIWGNEEFSYSVLRIIISS